MPESEDNKTLLSLAKGFFPHVATPAMLLTILFFGAKFIANSEHKQFDTPEDKVKVVRHVKEGPTAVQEREAQIMDSLNSISAIQSRAFRDSVFTDIVKRQKRADSIDLLNADQMFQIKQELKKINTRQ